MIKAVLPVMRAQRSGIIVNISSGAGRIGYPTVSGYVSSKVALEGLCESFSYETHQFGIRILFIEPGCAKSNFVNGMVHAKNASNSTSAFSALLKKFQSNYNIAMQNAPTPEKVTNVVMHAITDENPELRYSAGEDVEMLLDARNRMSD
jgi:NAD(P)-dependent dehydrogenase (short-subunit alcohol dehydrogenase family)